MRFLIVEDEFVARRLMQRFLEKYGEVDVAVNGEEALDAVRAALEEQQPYSLISLDMLMPKMDGHDALRRIRALEAERGVSPGKAAKVVMATSVSNPKTVLAAFKDQTDGFLVKPVDKQKLYALLEQFGLAKGKSEAA